MSDTASIIFAAYVGLMVGLLLTAVAEDGALDNTWLARLWRTIRNTMPGGKS